MKKIIIIVFVLIILAGGIFVVYKLWPPKKTSKEAEGEQINYSLVKIGGKEIRAEVVDNEASRMKGLSGRESLALNEGMLFVFEKPDIYPFWMKEMKFSIDIIWLKNNKIIEIINSAEPPTLNGKTITYTPRAEADIVLELNGGFCQENGVKIGDEVSIK